MKQKIKLKYKYLLISFLALLLFSRCTINEPTAPQWDVPFNLPIAKRNYTLYDIIEKKSSEIKHYTQGPNTGLLYYTDVKDLDKITINDELKIDPFSERKTKEIGIISLDPDSIQTNVGYEWVGAPITPGTQVVLPAVVNSSFSTVFNSVDQFQIATIETGIIDLAFTNNISANVTLVISDIEIRNAQSGELIVKKSSPTEIKPLQKVVVPDLEITSGVIAKNTLILYCKISTAGSGGQTVTLPEKSLSVKAIMKEVEVSQAIGKIPAQDPVVVNGSVAIEEGSLKPTKFQTVKLEGGLLNFTLTNNLDVDAKATVTVNNLKDESGKIFAFQRTVPRKQSIKVFENYSLKDYILFAEGGIATNKVSYVISFEPLASSDNRTIKSSDDVIGDVGFSNLQIKEFAGILKPTALKQTKSSILFDVKDLQNKLHFKELNLKNPVIQLNLNFTADVEFLIDGKMEAKDASGQRSVMTLSKRTLNDPLIKTKNAVVTINPDSLNNFFKKFTKFPDSLIIYTGGTINPDYKTANIKKSDVVTGQSNIEIPLEFGISGGEMSDSLKVDLSTDNRDKIKKLNSLEVKFDIKNEIPVDFKISGMLFDEFDNFLMFFPEKNNAADTIKVSGIVSQQVSVKMQAGDPEKLARAKYARINFRFNTGGQSNAPVKLYTNDAINFSAIGLLNYSVKK